MFLNEETAAAVQHHNHLQQRSSNSCKNNNENKQQATNTSGTGTTRILKSFYKKDALASVTDSLLGLDEIYSTTRLTITRPSIVSASSSSPSSSIEPKTAVTLSTPNTAIASNTKSSSSQQNSSSSATSSSYSLSSTSTTTNNHQSNISPNDQLDRANCSRNQSSSSSSCIQFVNQLVEPKIKQLNDASINNTNSNGSIMYNNNNSRSLVTTTLNPAAMTAVPTSQYAYANTYMTTAAANTTIKPSPVYPSTAQYQQQSQQLSASPNVSLLSKKLRKYLPFNCGLKNHGNTCFMNCVLQSLFHTSPLADFFITMQFEQEIREILAEQQQQQIVQNNVNTATTMSTNTKQGNQFLLTRHFYRLFSAMWTNSYDGNYSAEMKNTIGYLNPMFAGAQQNDSHEFCVWLLDRLSSELAHKIPSNPATTANTLVEIATVDHASSSPQLGRAHRSTNDMEATGRRRLRPPRHRYYYASIVDRNASSDDDDNMYEDSDDADEERDDQDNSRQQYNTQSQQQEQQKPKINTNNNNTVTTSFIEELFKIEFRSTVICSKCGYKSSKVETDMMLSLPLPQNQQSSNGGGVNRKLNQQKPPRPFDRRSLYFNLMVANSTSIRILTSSGQCIPTSNDLPDHQLLNGSTMGAVNSRFYINETSLDNSTNGVSSSSSGSDNLLPIAPLHVRLGVNLHLSTDQSIEREIISLNSESPPSTVLNPTYGDLCQYIEGACKLPSSSALVFVDLAQPEMFLCHLDSLKETVKNGNVVDLFAVELISSSSGSLSKDSLQQQSEIQHQHQQPMINLVTVNVYPRSSINAVITSNNDASVAPDRTLATFGVPFPVLINRDCTYPELCRKLLESQYKYLSDRNVLKYRDLAQKMFTLSLVDPNSKKLHRLNPSDELPLYAECIDKALNDSARLAQDHNRNSNISNNNNYFAEYIRINIEWRSYNDLVGILREEESSKAEYIHRTVQQLQRYDEQESTAAAASPSDDSSQSTPPYNQSGGSTTNTSANATNTSTITLDDCFELFTQCEELSDENSWMCTKCKKQTNAYKKLCISSVPPVLIIHLKRFFYKSKTSNFKLTTPVWYPVANLDMSKYLAKNAKKSNGNSRRVIADEIDSSSNSSIHSQSQSNKSSSSINSKYIYDLFAVCNHKGQNMANGHYTAYCKNPVDTRWYCFDDSACTPLFDANLSPSNIYNTGSANILSENAYILFYKRRGCLRNERWWRPYVDRTLFEYDEFNTYMANLDAIERLQRQKNITISQVNQGGSTVSSRRMTSLKHIKERLLGNISSNSSTQQLTAVATDLIDTVGYESNSGGREVLYSRSAMSNSNNPYSNNYETSSYLSTGTTFNGGIVNHYDEFNKPKRLLKKINTKENFANANKLPSVSLTPAATNSSSVDSSPASSSSSSSSSYNHNHRNQNYSGEVVMEKNLINLNDPMSEKIDSIKALSRDLSQQLTLNNNNSNSNGSNNDFIFKYPSDNEYIYSHQHQHQQQQHQQRILRQQPSDFYYHVPHPANAYFQHQQQYHHNHLSHQQQQQLVQNRPVQTQSVNATTSNRTAKYVNPASIETPI